MATATVLIVDDSADLLQGLQELLQLYGHTVYIAMDCQEARRLWALKPITVALIDWGLPDCVGTELTREFKAQKPETRIAIITGHQKIDVADPTAADLILTKPFLIPELLAFVDGGADAPDAA